MNICRMKEPTMNVGSFIILSGYIHDRTVAFFRLIHSGSIISGCCNRVSAYRDNPNSMSHHA